MVHTTQMNSLKDSAWITSGTLVEMQWSAAGYCSHPEFLTLHGGAWKAVPFPAGFACIRHPRHGYILFDTGYSERFFEETKRLPALLYRLITPVNFSEGDSAVNQLRRMGIEAKDVTYVVLSHFHADHTAGLRDFSHARIIYKREAYDAVRTLGPFAAVKSGYLSGLLPEDFEQRSLYVEEARPHTLPENLPFVSGYDLFGDGSLIAVDVPGHAAGQIGLFLRTASGEHFLCADTVWSSRAYRERRKPHSAARLIMDNYKQYEDSFDRLCRLHQQCPHIAIIPSHCGESLLRWRRGEDT
ncbi:N-acyl homoserine lactonase AttM [compost metagenome]